MNRPQIKPIASVFLALGAVATFALAAAGCGSSSSTSSANSVSEIAESAMSGAVNSTEPNGTQAVYLDHPSKSLFARLQDLFLPQSFAATACPTLVNTACVSGNTALAYSSCSFGASSTLWKGGQNISFSAGCPTTITAINLYNGIAVTRTFTTGTTETTSAGVTTTLDTTGASSSGWDSSITVTNGETASFNNTTGGRTLALGLHLHGVDSGGTVLFDHTVSASSISVTGSGTSRVISTGTGVMTVQHNLLKYTGTINITTALSYGTAACCHPSSGVLTTQLSGSQTGIETLTFNSGTCGAATYVGTDKKSTDITLTHCF